MTTETPVPPTLEDVVTYIFERRHNKRARTLITDHRFLAGLLFPRPNDRIRYRLVNLDHPTRPTVDLTWSRDGMMLDGTDRFLVAIEAVQELQKLGLLSPARAFGVLHQTRFELNQDGKRMVVREWFSESSTVLDKLSAGGVLREGEITYPHII